MPLVGLQEPQGHGTETRLVVIRTATRLGEILVGKEWVGEDFLTVIEVFVGVGGGSGEWVVGVVGVVVSKPKETERQQLWTKVLSVPKMKMKKTTAKMREI